MSSVKKTRLREEQRKRERRRRMMTLLLAGAGVLVTILLVVFLTRGADPGPVETITVPPGYEQHVEEGTPPGPFASDPPAGGVHYGGTFPAGFYDESDVETLPEHPEGYLVHDLEHGYVIFWYDCSELEGDSCEGLKSQIRDVMADFNNREVVAFPWESIDTPVVMTSWGHLLRFETFSPDRARAFVEKYQNTSPEAQAP